MKKFVIKHAKSGEIEIVQGLAVASDIEVLWSGLPDDFIPTELQQDVEADKAAKQAEQDRLKAEKKAAEDAIEDFRKKPKASVKLEDLYDIIMKLIERAR